MNSKLWFVAAVLAATSTCASAQAWIGAIAADAANQAQIGRCLKGRMSISQKELDEVRVPAQGMVSNYWARASGGAPADVTPAFQSVGTAIWVDGSTELKRNSMKDLRDPFALDPTLAIASEPTSFARSIAAHNNAARGVWPVVSRSDPAKIAGYYVIDFERFMYRWGISRIVLVHAPAEIPVAQPFCAAPGDIEEAAAARAEKEARRAAKRAARAQATAQ